jgi:hypothetical protein
VAYDEGAAQLLRDDLEPHTGISEKKMFGGLCFMMNCNMLCGVHKDGNMFRVGKENEPQAMALEGSKPMGFTGRKMGGMVELDEDCFTQDSLRANMLDLAVKFMKSLPTK